MSEESTFLKQQRASAKKHYNDLQQWLIDAEHVFSRSVGSTKARMAAGGVKEGSKQWDLAIEAERDRHGKELTSIRKGPTSRILDQYVADTKNIMQREYMARNRSSAAASGVDEGKPTTPAELGGNIRDRELQETFKKAGIENWYGKALERGTLTEKEFRDMPVETFLSIDLGITDVDKALGGPNKGSPIRSRGETQAPTPAGKPSAKALSRVEADKRQPAARRSQSGGSTRSPWWG